MNPKSFKFLLGSIVVASFLITGCSTTLVHDNVMQNEANLAHCSGSESVDDSTIAVLPIPIVAFFTPRADVNEIRADQFLNRCGDSTRLVNRQVEVSRYGCIPASLTYFLTLGIWQWCPATVEWDADVRQ